MVPEETRLYARWTFDDGMGDIYQFRVNPNEMSSPWEDINVTASGTVAPDGGILLVEGARQVKEFTISGVVLSEGQYFEMIAWKNKRRRVYLTDHFGRRMVVFIKSFNPTPKRRTSYLHQYDMVMLILGEMTNSTYASSPTDGTSETTDTNTSDTTSVPSPSDPSGTTTEDSATITWSI